jgi:outer membrane murein-binding lipoprotein Lpp
MKILRILVMSLTYMAFLVLSGSAEVRVTLKNGRSFIADYCKETNGKLVCDISGGMVEFSKQEIESIKEMKMKKDTASEEAPSEVPGEEQENNRGKQAGSVKTEGEPRPAKTVGGLTAEQERRFDELEKRRAELAADRDRLIKDRDLLQQEVKDAGVIRSREKADAIQQKINSLDERIKGFNEQVNKLNEEINALPTEGQKKK